MKLYEPQSAHLMYPFKGGWDVMRYVKDNVFARTAAEAATWSKRGEPWKEKATNSSSIWEKYYYWCAYAGFVMAGWSQYITAILVVALFVAVQFVLLSILAALACVLMGVLAAGTFLYASYYKIFTRCPHCYEQMPVATFVCPSCATKHTRLWPSVYGVFRHRCMTCNTKLPTLSFLGRKKLTKLCAACDHPINQDIDGMTNVHIPVIGGPSTGKSNFIMMAVHGIIEEHAPRHKYSAFFSDDNDRIRYEQSLARLNSGTALVKTPEVVPQAYTLSIKNGRRVGKLVYLYDAAGEAYLSEDSALLQTYYNYVHGIVFIIDPFSIPDIRRKYEIEIEKMDGLRPSTLDVMDAYERMLRVLEASADLQRGKKYPHPLAVVISKTDALDLEEHIGEPAATALMNGDTSLQLPEDAIDELVEQFLVGSGMDNFIRDINLQFETVRFFSCSALGRMPGTELGIPFKPQRAVEPLFWVLGQLGVFNLRKERAEAIKAYKQQGANSNSRNEDLEADIGDESEQQVVADVPVPDQYDSTAWN